MSRSILSTDLGIWPAIAGQNQVSDMMYHSLEIRSKIANYLLLYDQIFIPTGNFQILPVLRLLLGDGIFEELLRSKNLVFLRYDEWFGYAGNGRGLVFFQVGDNPDLPKAPNITSSFFSPIDEAVEVMLHHSLPKVDKEKLSYLKNLIIESTVDFDFFWN